MNKQTSILFTLFLFNSILLLSQVSNKAISQGYQNGSLILIGGGQVGEDIMDEFNKLAGGDSAEIVVIPTALEDEYLLKDSTLYFIKTNFEQYGDKKVTILHQPNQPWKKYLELYLSKCQYQISPIQINDYFNLLKN